jgi:hypothetical protein
MIYIFKHRISCMNAFGRLHIADVAQGYQPIRSEG